MLSIEQIKELISHGENEMIEFKSCTDKVTPSVSETVCSFLNREGGHIFLGVSDNKEISGVNKNSANDMMKNIINTLNNPQFIEPTICINPRLIEVDGKHIIYLNIPESLQVHHYKNRIYDRLGDADNDISKNHYLIDNMYLRKKREYSENEICPFVTIDDMDEETFKTMRSHISIHNENHPWLKMTNEEILHSAFWGKDRQTHEEGYMLAAVLLFGKEKAILSCCPAHRTDAIFRNISYERFLHPCPKTNCGFAVRMTNKTITV